MTGEKTPYSNSAVWEPLRLVILERDGWVCQIRGPRCLVDADTVDHIIPWRYGGAWYDPANLRAACQPCNLDRARKPGVSVGSTPSRDW